MIYRLITPDGTTHTYPNRKTAEHHIRDLETRGHRITPHPIHGKNDQVVAVEYRHTP